MQAKLPLLTSGKLLLSRQSKFTSWKHVRRPSSCRVLFREYQQLQHVSTSASALDVLATKQDVDEEAEPDGGLRLSRHSEDYWTKKGPPTPPVLLGQYLDIKDASGRASFVARVAKNFDHSSLPSILLYSMHENSAASLNDISRPNESTNPTSLSRMIRRYLERRQITEKEVAHWAWIVSGAHADEMLDRFFSTTSVKPPFILAEILRHDIKQVRSLERVLQYLFSERVKQPKASLEAAEPQCVYLDHSEHNAFEILVSRLLRQARQIWPPAITTMTQMIHGYFDSVMAEPSTEAVRRRRTARLTTMLNYFINLLSLPATVSPLSSAHYNWKAQKQLLELASKFEPPLLLSQNGYRSIVRTLVASRKTDMESKSVVLRTRSWPPWRRYQDGMDAKALLEQDFSRVISAISRMEEAGFRLDNLDEAARIYGGLEADGTPTIQTRRSLRKRRLSTRHNPARGEMSSHVWAARIEATRDVQEAWAAFLEYHKRGGQPSQSLFLAMFVKMNYESANSGRARPFTSAPGDGKEVMPVVNVNVSEYHIQRSLPPPFKTLYARMLASGIRPSGNCLTFLILKAKNSDEALGFMLDAGISKEVVTFLAGTDRTRHAPEALKKVPNRVLCAYIDLTCRLAQKNLPRSAGDFTLLERTTALAQGYVEGTTGKHSPSIWATLQPERALSKHIRQRETLNQASFILRATHMTFRPCWYAFFRTLARSAAVIPRQVTGNRQHHSLAWRVLLGALNAFRARGLEVDPQGFLYICTTFEHFAKEPLGETISPSIASGGRDRHALITEGLEVVKSTFAMLSESQQQCAAIPVLLHNLQGSHLHAYIRALWSVDDYEGVLSALEWMVAHHEELQVTAQESRNGFLSFEKTIIAVRLALDGTDLEEVAMRLVEEVSWWDGWPTEEQVRAYLLGPEESSAGEDELDSPPIKYPTNA